MLGARTWTFLGLRVFARFLGLSTKEFFEIQNSGFALPDLAPGRERASAA